MFYCNKVKELVDPEETEKRLKENPPELEKGDKLAMIMAAFAVLGPVLLILIGAIWLLYFLFT